MDVVDGVDVAGVVVAAAGVGSVDVVDGGAAESPQAASAIMPTAATHARARMDATVAKVGRSCPSGVSAQAHAIRVGHVVVPVSEDGCTDDEDDASAAALDA